MRKEKGKIRKIKIIRLKRRGIIERKFVNDIMTKREEMRTRRRKKRGE
jgi:hypothetical protein